MTATRNLTADERAAVFARIKPVGGFKPVKERKPFGTQPIAWENKLGNLDEWREHVGQGRAIAPVLSNVAKTASVRQSITTRLKKLFPGESWSTFTDDKYIYLKFCGKVRQYSARQRDEQEPAQAPASEAQQNGTYHELFATG